MPFAWLSDDFYDHPKVRALPKRIRNEAAGMFTRLISLSNRYLTDGQITDADLEAVDGRRVLVEALLEVPRGFDAGLLERRGEALWIHDFGQYSRTKRQVLADRRKKAAAGRKGGVASGKTRASKKAPRASTKREARPKQVLRESLNPESLSESPSESQSASTRSTHSARGPNGVSPDAHALQLLAEELTGKPYALANLHGGWGEKALHQLEARGLDAVSAAWRDAAAVAGPSPTVRQLILGADDVLFPVPRVTAKDAAEAEHQELLERVKRGERIGA